MNEIEMEYAIEEQKYFESDEKQSLKDLNLDFEKKNDKDVKFLGLDAYHFNVSYYIGLDWLKETEAYILVRPKIENLDYIKMFLHCLKHPEISPFVKDIYHFDFQKPKITPEIQIEMDFNLFLIAHFLELVKKITEQGLKKNYIQIEENLSSKIKGKIIWSQQIKKNIVAKREDRVFCRYQEYSVNCLENRLLKKTLLMVQRYLKHFDKDQIKSLIHTQNRLLKVFENISDDILYSQIKILKVNSLYKEYVEAIDLAKKIMQKFGYSYSNSDNIEKQKEMSPFWIDMSKLFELYVYSLLKEEYRKKEISYQPHGKYGNVDFLNLDEQLIIDTKYKLIYTDGKYNIEDIRQLSGYARDEGVLKTLKIFKSTKEIDDNVVVDCVIIYPDDSKHEDFKDRQLKEEKINGFTKFYKCGIKLPINNEQ